MDDLTILTTPKKILFMGYNYNSTYFTIGTDIGFQVHQTYPLALKFSRQLNGGIGLVKMLNKSNIFCLAGGGVSPKYAPNTLLIWDDKQRKEVHEFRFNYNVLNCHIKDKYIFVICSDIICVICKETLKKLEIISTIENPKGISTISNDKEKYILCWPDLDKGKISIKDFSKLKNNSVAISSGSNNFGSFFGNKISVKAHENSIYTMKLSNDGSLLATASERGTMIRIFDTIKGKMIQEVRRGTGDAKIYSINFSFDNNYLGTTSDHGTAHIFLLNNKKENASKKNDKDNKMNSFISINNKDIESSQIIDNKYNKNQSYLLSGVTKLMGFNTIKSFASFKTCYKEESFITFIDNDEIHDINNKNKVIVIDKSGNYIIVEIRNEQDAKIIKEEYLI